MRPRTFLLLVMTAALVAGSVSTAASRPVRPKATASTFVPDPEKSKSCRDDALSFLIDVSWYFPRRHDWRHINYRFDTQNFADECHQYGALTVKLYAEGYRQSDIYGRHPHHFSPARKVYGDLLREHSQYYHVRQTLRRSVPRRYRNYNLFVVYYATWTPSKAVGGKPVTHRNVGS